MITQRFLILVLAALPALGAAQRPQPPMPPAPAMPPMPAMPAAQGMQARMGMGVTRLLNLRRQLELTPRQVMQLDSVERVLFAERKAMMERMQGERRALQQQRRPMLLDSMRARMQQRQPQMAQWRQRDSVALASAERLLTEPQRQKLREIRAYARGRADAMRQTRGPRGGQGMRQMRPMPGMPGMPGMRPMQGRGQGMRGGNQEVEVEIRREAPGGEEVRIERRITRPPA
ncbi:MAG: hypothetical protein RL625_1425 [Gemmatimonadota bacterium]